MKEKLPVHIAIIMDGNGRWAKKRNKSRVYGHRQGIRVVKEVIDYSVKRGIKYLTLYTFSSENWQRPKMEVRALMGFLKQYLKKEGDWLNSIGVRLNIIGDRNRLAEEVKIIANEVENLTKDNDKMVLNLALSYGGRDEIVRAVKNIINGAKENNNFILNEENFRYFLDTKDQPDPDLIIRTSGEYRISNFLLWQSAYSEFYFTKTLWPDFTTEELESAIQSFMRRERRFGKV
mgnify:CR=1 FL=1